MQQDLRQRCLHFCNHIETVTGTTCVLLDIRSGSFEGTPFSYSCDLSGGPCDAITTHLYGTYEAERWGDKYIYYCPRGLIFIATPVRAGSAAADYCLITGPIIMSNFPDDNRYGDLWNIEGLDHVPSMTTAQTRSFSELIHAACAHLAGDAAPDIDSGGHAEMLQMMYEISARVPEESSKRYPITSERQLQQMIREGDKEGAQKLLNELLGYIYFASGADFRVVKTRMVELLVLMSRAAIEGGGDIAEIFWLSDNYVAEVEKFHDLEALSRWLSAVVHKFISCVFDFSDVKHRDIMFKITEYVKLNLTEKLTVEEAADYVYLSKSHLSRILRQELGCTFTEYVNRQRIDRSKILLMDSRLSLADIAGAVGFDDQSYYTKVFKKVTGVTPGKYREQRM